MPNFDELWNLIDALEARIEARREQLRLAAAAAQALDEKIISNMAERLVYETELVLRDAAGE
jgi:hypothetical protein